MFTGIVQTIGTVSALLRRDSGIRLAIDPHDWSYMPTPGDSIAVAGVCLTHAPDADHARPLIFDIINETLSKTTLGRLAVGSRVNLESSLTPSTPIAGHFVQGHVDGLATVAAIEATPRDHRITLEAPDSLLSYIAPTGSIAIDGVSLTVAFVDPAAHRFTVALIPTTLQNTTLGDLKVGDHVNIETDMLVRAAVHYIKSYAGK